jgi:ribosomal protein L19
MFGIGTGVMTPRTRRIRVVVNDRIQRGYLYYRPEPAGRTFAPGFEPDLTPKEI